MKIKTNIYIIDLFSLSLVLSFFIIHNIYCVFLGIILSFCSINKTLIKILIKNNHINELDKVFSKKEELIELKNQNNEINNENSDIRLVDEIEELGFIPSKKALKKVKQHN